MLPARRTPGPICDGKGNVQYVMYLTKRQYRKYRAGQKLAVQELRDKMRRHFRTKRQTDAFVDAFLTSFWSKRRTIPIEIIGERSRKKINYVGL